MTQWLARAEGKYLDLITHGNWALVDLYFKNKKPVLNADILKHALERYDLGIRFEQEWSWIKTRADGRYKREVCYVLESLNLARGPTLSFLNIEKYSDFFKKDIKNQMVAFATGRKSNVYIPTALGIRLSKYEFCSKEWYQIMINQVLSYGYFVRYLDTINELQKLKERINLSDIQNKIGPIGTTIIGGGPQFIQAAFKEWGFYLDVFDIETKTGSSLKNSSSEKLKKLSRKIMDWKTNISALGNVKNNLKFIIKKEVIQPVRVPQLSRLILNWEWSRDYNNAIEIATRRAIIILILGSNTNKLIKLNNLIEVIRKKMGIKFETSKIKDDLAYLRCAGLNISLVGESVISKRAIDLNEFSYYLPSGGFFKNV